MLQREEASCNEVRKFEYVLRPLYMTYIVNTQHPQTSFAGESCSYLHFKSIVQNTFHIFGFVHKLLKSEEIIFKKKESGQNLLITSAALFLQFLTLLECVNP